MRSPFWGISGEELKKLKWILFKIKWDYAESTVYSQDALLIIEHHELSDLGSELKKLIFDGRNNSTSSMSGFLNFSTIDILDDVILCWRVLLCAVSSSQLSRFPSVPRSPVP